MLKDVKADVSSAPNECEPLNANWRCGGTVGNKADNSLRCRLTMLHSNVRDLIHISISKCGSLDMALNVMEHCKNALRTGATPDEVRRRRELMYTAIRSSRSDKAAVV